MTMTVAQRETLDRLLYAVRDEELTDAQAAELESIALEHPEAMRHYLRVVNLTAGLRWLAENENESADLDRQTLDSPPVVPLLSTPTSPLSPAFVGGPVFSYMVATVVLCLMLLGGWAYKISHSTQGSVDTVRNERHTPPSPTLVGRITGVKDCRWSDPDTQTVVGASVFLDRQYALASGLLEITYKSGARVILEGPCTYKVDSNVSGLLKLGKLTARVETKGSGFRVQGSKHSPLSTLHSPLFAVRTPTAKITDLGTEFGVEVDELGNTESHVFSGIVQIRKVGESGTRDRVITLSAGQTGGCDQTGIMLKSPKTSDKNRFVRSIGFDAANAEHITEHFEAVQLDPSFEQSPSGRFIISNGAAEYRNPPDNSGRGYIRTRMTDFCDRDFIFEATIDVRVGQTDANDITRQVFFGIGDGVPNADFYDTVTCGLNLSFTVDNGWLQVLVRRPGFTQNETVIRMATGEGKGRHCFQMWKRGRQVGFAMDANFNGKFQIDYSSPPIDIATTAPLLNKRNSRLFIGTGNCDAGTIRFEDMSVSFSNPRSAK